MIDAIHAGRKQLAINAEYKSARPGIPVYQDFALSTWDILGSGRVSGVSIGLDVLNGLAEWGSVENVTQRLRGMRKHGLYDPRVIFYAERDGVAAYEALFHEAVQNLTRQVGPSYSCDIFRKSESVGYAYANTWHAVGQYHSRELSCMEKGSTAHLVVNVFAKQTAENHAEAVITIGRGPVPGGSLFDTSSEVDASLNTAAHISDLKFGLYDEFKTAFIGWEAISTGPDASQGYKWIGVWTDGKERVKFELPPLGISKATVDQLMARRKNVLRAN